MRTTPKQAKVCRSWKVRVSRALALGVAAVVLGTAGIITAWLNGIHVPIASGRSYIKLTAVDQASFGGEPDKPFFILLIGSDLRPGVGGARGDALHLLGVNPVRGQATMVDIPRDTCADVPGEGTTKINAAHAKGGPKLQADVVSKLVGVPIAYAVSVDFAGFTSIVDEAGGVTVDVPTKMHDSYSGAFFDPGVQHFSGDQALRFSRDRHDFPRSDIIRTHNQGLLLISAIQQLVESHRSPIGRLSLLASLGRHASISGASLTDLYRLGRVAFTLDAAHIANVTLPITGGSCLKLAADAPSFFADLADDAVLETYVPKS